MTIYSTATPVVGANIVVQGAEAKAVAVGDTLANLVLATRGEDETIESATVVGFKLGPAEIPRGTATILDGIPTYLRDPNGGSYHGTAEEVYTVTDMVIEVPVAEADTAAEPEEDEEAEPKTETRVVRIANIKDLGTVTPIGNPSGDGQGEEEAP